MKTIHIQPINQKVWRLPAAANFVLAGAGAGSYALSFHIDFLSPGAEHAAHLDALRLFSILLVCLGFLLVAAEAGRPLRGRYIFRNLRSSWMSREVLALAIFIASSILEYLYSSAEVRTIASVSALGLILSQGFMVYRSRAIAAWNVPVMPVLFLSSGLLSGYGLILFLSAMVNYPLAKSTYLLGIACILLDAVIWFYYLDGNWFPEVSESLKTLGGPLALVVNIIAGHAFPAVLILSVMAGPEGGMMRLLSLTTGMILFGTGALMKAGIPVTAGNLRAISLDIERIRRQI